MTTKELAEKAAEFLGAEHTNTHIYKLVVEKQLIFISKRSLFENIGTAPILMHLAKREMEKLGFVNNEWQYYEVDGDYFHSYEFIHKDKKGYRTNFTGKLKVPLYGHGEDDNEFIAFWTALLKATR